MIEFLKAIFNGNALTQEQFEAALPGANIKLCNLSDGNYVSKTKYENDLQSKKDNIQTLTDTIKERDDTLATLQKQLETAGTDKEQLEKLQGQFTALVQKAEADKKDYEASLKKVANKSACKEFAADLEFKTKANKEHFINYMIAQNLNMDGDKLIGAADCLEKYKAEYADSFKEEEEKNPNPHSVNRMKTPPATPEFNLTEFMKQTATKG